MECREEILVHRKIVRGDVMSEVGQSYEVRSAGGPSWFLGPSSARIVVFSISGSSPPRSCGDDTTGGVWWARNPPQMR